MRLLDWRGHVPLLLLARLYLGGLFIYAAWHKIADPSAFALDVATYQMLPLGWINLTALILPWLEVFAGILLVIGFRVRAGALLVAGMMVVFMVALGWALARGLHLSCGCFASQTGDPLSWLTMLRDTAWLALALYVMWLERPALGLDALIERRRASAA